MVHKGTILVAVVAGAFGGITATLVMNSFDKSEKPTDTVSESSKAGDAADSQRTQQSKKRGNWAPRVNEPAAVATIRNAVMAQAQVQQSAKIDVDMDGVGEHGGHKELSGALKGRMNEKLFPPVLSGAFQHLRDPGVVLRSGYCYRIFLPGEDGAPVGEPTNGYLGNSAIDADLAEKNFVVYAWPVEYGKTGNRTFVVNQLGDVLATESKTYSGADAGPAGDAAYVGSSLTAPLANGVKANDGNVWKIVP